MRSTSFSLVQRVAVLVIRSTHSSMSWDLAVNIFNLAIPRSILHVHVPLKKGALNVRGCDLHVCLYCIGVHEGEAEAGPTGRAGGQSPRKDCRHSEMDSSKASQMSIPSRQKISSYDTSMLCTSCGTCMYVNRPSSRMRTFSTMTCNVSCTALCTNTWYMHLTCSEQNIHVHVYMLHQRCLLITSIIFCVIYMYIYSVQ